MTTKFNYEGYTICISFRSENSLSMTASYNLTGEHFINEMIELGKIKKDTVIATLARKSEKNLWCTFKMVDSEPRKLIVSFTCKFDFLPEFSEDVTLQYMQIKGQVFNKISSAELQSDIEELQKILDSIKQNGTITLQEKNSSVTKKTEITSFDLKRGFYLLQMSGVLTNAAVIGDSLELTIRQEGQEDVKLKQKSHSQSGYGYPFSFSQRVESKGGKITLIASNSQSGAAALSSQIITLIPIVA